MGYVKFIFYFIFFILINLCPSALFDAIVSHTKNMIRNYRLQKILISFDLEADRSIKSEPIIVADVIMLS